MTHLTQIPQAVTGILCLKTPINSAVGDDVALTSNILDGGEWNGEILPYSQRWQSCLAAQRRYTTQRRPKLHMASTILLGK